MKRTLRKVHVSGKKTQKVLLFSVLSILLWSRMLSSFATIQDVKTSFSLPAFASDDTIAMTVPADISVETHVNSQMQLAGQRDVRLEEMSEHGQKVRKVEEFYARWNAPLGAHADYIVQVSEELGLDYRLIPAISIVESSGGQHCFRSYNAWGWGKSGFTSFEQGIYTVGNGLANGYHTSNPYAIAPRYNPVTPDSWANKVSSLMSQI